MNFDLPGGPPAHKQAVDRFLRQVLSFPFRLWRVATADLPTATTDNEGGLVYDETTSRLTYSDGSAWLGLQPYDADVAAYAALSATGIVVRTGAGTAATRTITGTANEITVTNGDGVSGNPTLSLPTALALTGKTVTGGTFASVTSLSIGAALPSGVTVHAQGAGIVQRLRNTSNGSGSLSRTMSGLEIVCSGMNVASAQFTPALKFMSTDADFTTENPKLLAGIVGRATEIYDADTKGGMALGFATTANGAGASSVPVVRAEVTAEGIEPFADDTYYLGKNDDDAPRAWKGLVLADQSNGKKYRIEMIAGVLTATDLTD